MWENTILVVVDATAGEHQPALERAAWLAKQAGARIELFESDVRGDVTAVAPAFGTWYVTSFRLPEGRVVDLHVLEQRQGTRR